MVTDTQVKTGYKQTDVGLIPIDWDIKTFKEISWVNQGLQIAIERRLKNPTQTSKIYITIQHLNSSQDPEYIDDYTKSVCCNKDDVLMTRTGNTGIVVSGVEGVFHNNFFKINYDKKQITKDFLVYYLEQDETQKTILAKAGTSTIPDLNHNDFYSISVPLPKIPEQNLITSAINDINNLIDRLEQLIEKKRNIKQGTMQELLTGKRRLPGFSGEWEAKCLGDIGVCYRGVSYNPNEDLSLYDTDNTIRLLRSNNVQESQIVYEDMQYVDKKRVAEHQLLRNNDILVCMANGSRPLVGKAGKFTSEGGYAYTYGAFMGCFRPIAANVNTNFVYFLFQTNEYRSHIDILLAGSSINNLKPSDLENFETEIPKDKEEQSAIAKVLLDIEKEISLLEIQKYKYLEIKQGMMQKLLTGRIRLI